MAQPVLRAAMCAALLSLVGTPVLAHAELIAGTPGPGATVEGSPSGLVLRFSQNLNPSRTLAEVRDSAGATIARGGATGGGPREWLLDLPVLPPGSYEVRWTSFSSDDGELARGTYAFTIVAPPTPSPTAAPSPTPAPASASPSPTRPLAPTVPPTAPPELSPRPSTNLNSGADGGVLLPIVVALLAVAAMGFWLLRGRAR